jgi:cation:H+ antiporter
VFVYLQEKRAPDQAALVAEHRAQDARSGPRQRTLSLAMAVGTSMPELVTSVMAALRKHADVALWQYCGVEYL